MWNKIRQAVLLDLEIHFGQKVENKRLLGCLGKLLVNLLRSDSLQTFHFFLYITQYTICFWYKL